LYRLEKRSKTLDRSVPLQEARQANNNNIISFLDLVRQEDPIVARYLQMSPSERIQHAMAQAPAYLPEIADRLAFLHAVLEPAISGNQLEQLAVKRIGPDLNQHRLRGYTRIFAEFIGHFASAWEQLRYEEYRKGIFETVKNYQPQPV
jgi:hypothetical protein